jgi:hypothetical protein
MLNGSIQENETNHKNVQTSGVGSVFKVYNVNCIEKIDLGRRRDIKENEWRELKQRVGGVLIYFLERPWHRTVISYF